MKRITDIPMIDGKIPVIVIGSSECPIKTDWPVVYAPFPIGTSKGEIQMTADKPLEHYIDTRKIEAISDDLLAGGCRIRLGYGHLVQIFHMSASEVVELLHEKD